MQLDSNPTRAYQFARSELFGLGVDYPILLPARIEASPRTTSSASGRSTSSEDSGTGHLCRRGDAPGRLVARTLVEPVVLIVTVRNEATTIGPLLDSILSGTRIPDEIVVADGGSSDGTLEVLRSRAAAHSRIRACWRRATARWPERRRSALRARPSWPAPTRARK